MTYEGSLCPRCFGKGTIVKNHPTIWGLQSTRDCDCPAGICGKVSKDLLSRQQETSFDAVMREGVFGKPGVGSYTMRWIPLDQEVKEGDLVFAHATEASKDGKVKAALSPLHDTARCRFGSFKDDNDFAAPVNPAFERTWDRP